MNLIAQHPYFKVERTVTGTEQYEVEHNRIIYLYNDKVVTQHREFPINIVMDFSYREIAKQGGILYLHTLQGVYTYTVKSSPEAFISAYRDYFK
ncbi:hypothetical protein [Solibacillus isronensis]|uniref:hypothetical protein n=1 Tax=Solibacillus isronensis TaxID=412383 RepID=UPI0009A720C4|nr:hypothetical protein [Solibacillus isronensis]